MTKQTFCRLPDAGGQRFTYVVTTLDRMSNESKPAKAKVTH